MTAASAATHSTSAMSSKKLWVTNSVMCFTPPPGDRTAAGSSGESFLAAHGLGWHAPNAASLHVTGDNTTFRAVCDEDFTLQRTGATLSKAFERGPKPLKAGAVGSESYRSPKSLRNSAPRSRLGTLLGSCFAA